ncbi:hypothetical protein D3C76_1352190 [compost metagenome]
MLFYDFGDVAITGGAGQHEAGQTAVSEEGQRQSQDQHGNQRPEATYTGVDRQEEHTGTDSGTVQTQHPDQVGLIDATGSLTG